MKHDNGKGVAWTKSELAGALRGGGNRGIRVRKKTWTISFYVYSTAGKPYDTLGRINGGKINHASSVGGPQKMNYH